MYFKDKYNTNIDNDFKNDRFNMMDFFSKYKIILISLFIILIIIIIISIIFLNKNTIFLTLTGDEIITIYEGSDYIEPGYKAYNSKDDDLKKKVKITSNLDTKTVGEYEINYILDDVIKTRKVIVIKKPQIYTFIRLNAINNNINIYLKLGEEYKEPGFQVFSSTGKDLNDRVKITGNVDTSKKGIYTLVYSLVDTNGVTITSTRTITVMDTEISLTLSNIEYTNQDIFINITIIDTYFDYMILPDGSKIYQNNYSYKVSINGSYTFKTYNKKGMIKEQSIQVNNIDKETPTGSCGGSYKNGKSTINVSAKDNVGIKIYEINGTSYANNQITINKELTNVTVKIYDKAGNTKNISCSLKNNNTTSSSSSSKPSTSKPSSSSSKPSTSKPSSSSSKPSTYYKREFSVKLYKGSNGKESAYWLYIPDGATDNMPLIVFLHGSEGKGNDYKNNTRLAIQIGPGNDIYNKRREYNAIMLMPQVRYNNYLNVDELMELIDYVANEYKVNKNKISISAASEGANRLNNYIGNNASYFSAIVFLGTYLSHPEKYTSVPVLTLCGEYDYGRNNSMIKFTNNVNELGGNAKHYTVPGQEHNIVSSYYSVFRDEKYDLVNWMIKQTKK